MCKSAKIAVCLIVLVFVGIAQAQVRDRTAEIKRLTVLAEHGDAEAAYQLGEIYRYVTNFPNDISIAAKWYEKAAEAGYPKAQFVLGVFYMGGMGVPRDYVLAYKWLSLANASTPDTETGESKNALFMLNSVETAMTPGQIAGAQRLAREWWMKHRLAKP